MNDLRNDPDAIDPVAERTAWLRQWQPVAPDAPRSNTELHTADGRRFTNIALPAGTVQALPSVVPKWEIDIRDAGQKLADLERRVMRIEVAVERIADAVQVLVLEREGGA